jgi:hypothetical protein
MTLDKLRKIPTHHVEEPRHEKRIEVVPDGEGWTIYLFGSNDEVLYSEYARTYSETKAIVEEIKDRTDVKKVRGLKNKRKRRKQRIPGEDNLMNMVGRVKHMGTFRY